MSNSTYGELYPEVESLRVEVKQYRYNELKGREILDETSTEQWVYCTQERCRRGRIFIRLVIDKVVKGRLTEFETTEICPGYVGSPKLRNIDSKCFREFRVKIDVKYRDGDMPPLNATASS